ncbi:hypothetical protein [Sphingobacterium sp. DR205]|uniref:hypothetical protein n=1 Tax=Sphingobacterium sp. DR205 TaxID=2713573 RepID=UPI0013E4CD2E|nr:hypothetical protein [Sphingobacterium sp. DR205]QIH32629.1 hypothetical protein G6053_06850 [Sphingobacterium sp. DR205]
MILDRTSTVAVWIRIILIFGFFSGPVYGQQEVRKIYIHTDREAYFPGDSVWFKSYVVQHGYLDSSAINLHLNLADQQGNIVRSMLSLQRGGMSDGVFLLPSDWKQTSIYINAYVGTDKGMIERYYFKEIPIIQINDQNKNDSDSGAITVNCSLIARPEGNRFLQNKNNRLYLQTIEASEKPLLVKGTILKSDGDLLSGFQLDSSGYGVVDIPPFIGNCRIEWEVDGKRKTDILLKTELGRKIYSRDIGDTIAVYLESNLPAERTKIILTSNDRSVLIDTITIRPDRRTVIYLNRNDLDYGLLRLELRDQQDSIHSQSAHFVGGLRDIQVVPNIKWLQITRKERGKNSFRLSLPSDEEGNLSISITALEVPNDCVPNITEDIYFRPYLLRKEPVHSTHLFRNDKLQDGLIATSAWNSSSNLNFNRVQSTKDSVYYLQGQILMEGNKWGHFHKKLVDQITKNNGKGKPGGMSFGYKFPEDKVMRYKTIIPDLSGYFVVDNLIIRGTIATKLSAIEKKMMFDKFLVKYNFGPIKVDSTFFIPPLQQKFLAPQEWNESKWAYTPSSYRDKNGGIRLKEVKVDRSVQQRRIDYLEGRYAREKFKGPADAVLDPHNDRFVKALPLNFGEYARLNYTKIADSIRWDRVFVNNYEIRTNILKMEDLYDTSMDRIPYVKYFEKFKVDGSVTSVLYVYQMDPSEGDSYIGRALDEQEVEGYMREEHFKLIAYTDDLASDQFDARPTLYWNPGVKLDGSSKEMEISFFNNSNPEGFWITIQGITKSGKTIFFRDIIRASKR